MFKCTGGDFPASTAYGGGKITWGFGKDKTLMLKGNIASIEVSSSNSSQVEFTCKLVDGRSFVALADTKTYEAINNLSSGDAAPQSKPSFLDAAKSALSSMPKVYGMRKCTYCGGLPDWTKQCDATVTVTAGEVKIEANMLKKFIVPVSEITGCSFKTEEQISKDVTLTRLFLFGVFAFGMKKKTKEVQNFLVLTFNDRGVSVSAILTGPETVKLNSDITKARQENYMPSAPTTQPAATSSDTDAYGELEKAHQLMEKGIITEEEFNQKKKQLLGI